MKKVELTVGSIVSAVEGGAKNVSAVAKAHGYATPVSGGVTAKIRKLVPNVEGLIATALGAVTEVTKVVEVAKVVEVKLAKVEKAEKPLVVVGQRKSPFRGNVYPRVFAEAVAAGLTGPTEVKAFVEVTARKLNLDEQSVRFATLVMRIPNHVSNGGRAKDVAGKRGFMQVVEIVEAVTATATAG